VWLRSYVNPTPLPFLPYTCLPSPILCTRPMQRRFDPTSPHLLFPFLSFPSLPSPFLYSALDQCSVALILRHPTSSFLSFPSLPSPFLYSALDQCSVALILRHPTSSFLSFPFLRFPPLAFRSFPPICLSVCPFIRKHGQQRECFLSILLLP
jgi:hypothetical protein